MLLEQCRTIISLAYPYDAEKPATPEGYTMARYTEPWHEDYHNRLRKKARQLVASIRGLYPGSKSRVCVDSAPILERSFAYSSGMGFWGKNNMLIIPGYGSFVFLVEILTTAAISFDQDSSIIADRCGSCTRCLDACPTGALEAPYRLDAARCLSYLTIEYDGPLDAETGKRMGSCFLGCDICQEACPFNPVKNARNPCLPTLSAFLKMSNDPFERRFGKTALSRPGLKKIQRNIQAIVGRGG